MIKVGDFVRSRIALKKDRVGVVIKVDDILISVFFDDKNAPPLPESFWLYYEHELEVVGPLELYK